jgi:hypothetical protein
MVGDDASFCVNQNWIVESELGDTGRDLRDLCVRVGPGIPGVGDESFDYLPNFEQSEVA